MAMSPVFHPGLSVSTSYTSISCITPAIRKAARHTAHGENWDVPTTRYPRGFPRRLRGRTAITHSIYACVHLNPCRDVRTLENAPGNLRLEEHWAVNRTISGMDPR
jgi:hypothetical protein